MLIWRLYKRMKRLEEIVRWLALHVVAGAGIDEAPDEVKEMWKNQR